MPFPTTVSIFKIPDAAAPAPFVKVIATFPPGVPTPYASAAPFPREPPVTTATLPANFCPLLLLICFSVFVLNCYLFVSLSCLAAETDVVVQFEDIKPCLDVLAGLAEFSDKFGKKLERLGVAVWPALFKICRPGFDFPRSPRGFGMGLDPFKDFAVAFAGNQLLQKGF